MYRIFNSIFERIKNSDAQYKKKEKLDQNKGNKHHISQRRNEDERRK